MDNRQLTPIVLGQLSMVHPDIFQSSWSSAYI
jgi:hypothetical protein